ncbi:uncharacterized protein LOC131884844 [Tigriopus californicus]|uniref:uncharacterized protein LOC131884844 n=1 Tax=Tigriopus californicus TaxID=6832 RepID=UPI0027DAB2B6|nr:uncharacterized protein LOC131884844 [Tigriopus californicus]XP_059088716.1 uncharacterized protein LOC131884844 [Tigriopus californicus]XP_059088717.1 uncharacterized protein LOC131884844 [Tigriopus californicus]XP_059088718.1 uncharacterized protein LOC131884844 [Tigriopus californicus]
MSEQMEAVTKNSSVSAKSQPDSSELLKQVTDEQDRNEASNPVNIEAKTDEPLNVAQLNEGHTDPGNDTLEPVSSQSGEFSPMRVSPGRFSPTLDEISDGLSSIGSPDPYVSHQKSSEILPVSEKETRSKFSRERSRSPLSRSRSCASVTQGLKPASPLPYDECVNKDLSLVNDVSIDMSDALSTISDDELQKGEEATSPKPDSEVSLEQISEGGSDVEDDHPSSVSNISDGDIDEIDDGVDDFEEESCEDEVISRLREPLPYPTDQDGNRVVKVTKVIETARDRKQPEPLFPPGKQPKAKKATFLCLNCEQSGHRAKDCPTLECYKCHMKGHFSRECPNPPVVKVCLICSRKGHLDKDCWYNPANASAKSTQYSQFNSQRSHHRPPPPPPPPTLSAGPRETTHSQRFLPPAPKPPTISIDYGHRSNEVGQSFASPSAPLKRSKTLWLFFKEKLIQKNQNPELAQPMIMTWTMANHSEGTLADVMTRIRPKSQVELRLILIKELGRIEAKHIPMSVNVSELLDETVEYLMMYANPYSLPMSTTSSSFPSLRSSVSVSSSTADSFGAFQGSTSSSPSSAVNIDKIQNALKNVNAMERFKHLDKVIEGQLSGDIRAKMAYEGRWQSLAGLRGFISGKLQVMKEMFGISDDYIAVVSWTIQKLLAHVGFCDYTLQTMFTTYGRLYLEENLAEKLQPYGKDFPSGVTVNYIISTVSDYMRDLISAD